MKFDRQHTYNTFHATENLIRIWRVGRDNRGSVAGERISQRVGWVRYYGCARGWWLSGKKKPVCAARMGVRTTAFTARVWVNESKNGCSWEGGAL